MAEKYMGFPDWENGDPFQEKTSRSASPGGRKTAGMVSGGRVIPRYGLSHVRIVTKAHRLDNPRFNAQRTSALRYFIYPHEKR